jgi:hypothetical protein
MKIGLKMKSGQKASDERVSVLEVEVVLPE